MFEHQPLPLFLSNYMTYLSYVTQIDWKNVEISNAAASLISFFDHHAISCDVPKIFKYSTWQSATIDARQMVTDRKPQEVQ